jgi:hypothetical protein
MDWRVFLRKAGRLNVYSQGIYIRNTLPLRGRGDGTVLMQVLGQVQHLHTSLPISMIGHP